MTTLKHTFDWHAENRESFLGWFLPTVLAELTDQVAMEELSERTEKFTKVELCITVNGVEVDAKHFMERVRENMEWHAEREAKEIIRTLTSGDEFTEIIGDVSRHLRKQLQAAGVEFNEDEWYS